MAHEQNSDNARFLTRAPYSPDAIEEIFRKYYQDVLEATRKRTGLYHEAEDFVAEAFVVALWTLSSWKPGTDIRSKLAAEAYRWAWRHNRKVGTYRTTLAEDRELQEITDTQCYAPSPEALVMNAYERRELGTKLALAFSLLTERQQECLRLFYGQGNSVLTIATTLGVSPWTIRATIKQARVRLRRLLSMS